MKQRLVGTPVGLALQRVRSYLDLRGIPFSNSEQAAAVSNGIIAERLLIGLCLNKSTFLDIGAHIGSVFSAVRHSFPGISIVAIEADPNKASSLRKKFPDCSVLECAVGEKDETASFFISDTRTGYNSLAQNGGSSREVKVQVKTLDHLFPDISVDVIKIDIEGAELGALRGGAKLLERSPPLIMFESTGTGENSLGYCSSDLWQFLNDKGFLLFTPDRLAHDAPPLSLDVFIDAHHYPSRSVNFFAVPGQKRIEVRDAARIILGINSNGK